MPNSISVSETPASSLLLSEDARIGHEPCLSSIQFALTLLFLPQSNALATHEFMEYHDCIEDDGSHADPAVWIRRAPAF